MAVSSTTQGLMPVTHPTPEWRRTQASFNLMLATASTVVGMWTLALWTPAM